MYCILFFCFVLFLSTNIHGFSFHYFLMDISMCVSMWWFVHNWMNNMEDLVRIEGKKGIGVLHPHSQSVCVCVRYVLKPWRNNFHRRCCCEWQVMKTKHVGCFGCAHLHSHHISIYIPFCKLKWENNVDDDDDYYWKQSKC